MVCTDVAKCRAIIWKETTSLARGCLSLPRFFLYAQFTHGCPQTLRKGDVILICTVLETSVFCDENEGTYSFWYLGLISNAYGGCSIRFFLFIVSVLS